MAPNNTKDRVVILLNSTILSSTHCDLRYFVDELLQRATNTESIVGVAVYDVGAPVVPMVKRQE